MSNLCLSATHIVRTLANNPKTTQDYELLGWTITFFHGLYTRRPLTNQTLNPLEILGKLSHLRFIEQPCVIDALGIVSSLEADIPSRGTEG